MIYTARRNWEAPGREGLFFLPLSVAQHSFLSVPLRFCLRLLLFSTWFHVLLGRVSRGHRPRPGSPAMSRHPPRAACRARRAGAEAGTWVRQALVPHPGRCVPTEGRSVCPQASARQPGSHTCVGASQKLGVTFPPGRPGPGWLVCRACGVRACDRPPPLAGADLCSESDKREPGLETTRQSAGLKWPSRGRAHSPAAPAPASEPLLAREGP